MGAARVASDNGGASLPPRTTAIIARSIPPGRATIAPCAPPIPHDAISASIGKLLPTYGVLKIQRAIVLKEGLNPTLGLNLLLVVRSDLLGECLNGICCHPR